jgi:hypothetical protein
MSEYDALERRIAAIESRLDMEAGLRASMDRDLADVKVWTHQNTRMLQAVERTQSEHTETLREQTERLDAIEGSLTEVRTGVNRIVIMLDRLIERDEHPDVP